MNMKRRGFISGIAALTATTPEKVLRAAGTRLNPLDQSGAIPGSMLAGSPYGHAAGSTVPWYVTQKLKLIALKTLRPSWFEKKRRRSAGYVGNLDIDLASFVSMSPAMKICIQRERNYHRGIELELENYEIDEMNETFKP